LPEENPLLYTVLLFNCTRKVIFAEVYH